MHDRSNRARAPRATSPTRATTACWSTSTASFVPRDEARVSVFDSGFVLGDGIWEGLRLIEGRLVSLEAHLDRLYEGARSIALDIGLTRAELTQAVLDTLDATA